MNLDMLMQFDSKQRRPPNLFYSYRNIKLKLRVFPRGYSVAIVTSCVGEKTLNRLMMTGNLYDTIIEATNEKLRLHSSIKQ